MDDPDDTDFLLHHQVIAVPPVLPLDPTEPELFAFYRTSASCAAPSFAQEFLDRYPKDAEDLDLLRKETLRSPAT